jgi:hypothetical protein
MRVGELSPQWALDLVGHWVVFHDHHHGVPDMKAFIFMTDFFPGSPPLRQVRIFADPYETVIESLKTGQPMFGLFATYIQENEHKIVDVPVELMDWTAEQLSEMKAEKK